MVDTDGPLDFESEDLLLAPTVSAAKRNRKKVIGLDDLLADYYKEKGKLVERESKRTKSCKSYISDEDDDQAEAELSRQVDRCQQMMGGISGDDEISPWGIQVFGNQQAFPPLDLPELGSCALLQSFTNSEVNSLLELSPENGETLLKGLLVNGWLLKLVFARGHVENLIATWTLNLMFYSTQEDLMTSARDFWLAILSSQNKVNMPLNIQWLPSYPEVKKALDAYGFLSNSSLESAHDDSDHGGPPQNIRAWIKFVAACCQVRTVRPIFLTSQAEELVEIVICLFLDRRLQGLLMLLHECLLSLIGYFSDEEWDTSCNKIARCLASRVPRDVNCVQSVECISGVNARSKHLRSVVAYEALVSCLDTQITEAEEILKFLIEINVKDRSCDLFRVYIYLVLTENWLVFDQFLQGKTLINEMWGVFLRNCSIQISGADLRSYASKLRTKATFLLQGAITT